MKNRKKIFGIQKLMFCVVAFVIIIGFMTACGEPRGGGNNTVIAIVTE
jgi:hypothetical protein